LPDVVFTGEHGEGKNYGPMAFACNGKEQVWVGGRKFLMKEKLADFVIPAGIVVLFCVAKNIALKVTGNWLGFTGPYDTIILYFLLCTWIRVIRFEHRIRMNFLNSMKEIFGGINDEGTNEKNT